MSVMLLIISLPANKDTLVVTNKEVKINENKELRSTRLHLSYLKVVLFNRSFSAFTSMLQQRRIKSGR